MVKQILALLLSSQMHNYKIQNLQYVHPNGNIHYNKLLDRAVNYHLELFQTMHGPFLDRKLYATWEGSRHSNLLSRADRPYEHIQSWKNTSLIFILDIFCNSTLGGHNSRTVASNFYDNHFLKRENSNLQAQICIATHLLSFQTSARH